MGARVDDAAVKELLRRFRGGDRRSLSEALQALSLYVYNYPRIVFCSSMVTLLSASPAEV